MNSVFLRFFCHLFNSTSFVSPVRIKLTQVDCTSQFLLAQNTSFATAPLSVELERVYKD